MGFCPILSDYIKNKLKAIFQFYIKLYTLEWIALSNNQELNMTMINQDTPDYELHNSSIYVMLEQMYHFICILMLMYIYTSIVYEIFKNEQTDSLLEVNKTFDLYFETQEIMKENISNFNIKCVK